MPYALTFYGPSGHLRSPCQRFAWNPWLHDSLARQYKFVQIWKFFLPGAALNLFPPLWPKPRWPPCSWNCQVMLGCWWFCLSKSWLYLAVVPLAEFSCDFPQIFKYHISGCTRQTFTSTMSARGSGQGNMQCERPPRRVEDKHLQNITNKLMLVKSELGKMDFTK